MFRLLIVDDEKWIRDGLKSMIDWSSFEIGPVDLAKDGQEAINIIRDNRPDIVITDVVMPHMLGTDFVSWVHSYDPEIKVIMISGYDQFEYARKSFRTGAVDYLLKPIDEQELEKVLSDVIFQIKNKNIVSLSNSEESTLGSRKQVYYLTLDDHLKDGGLAVKTLFTVPEQADYNYCSCGVYFCERNRFLLERLEKQVLESLRSKKVFHDSIRFSEDIIFICGSEGNHSISLKKLLNDVVLSESEKIKCRQSVFIIMGPKTAGLTGLKNTMRELSFSRRNCMTLEYGLATDTEKIIESQKIGMPEAFKLLKHYNAQYEKYGLSWAIEESDSLIDDLLEISPALGLLELGSLLDSIMKHCIDCEIQKRHISTESFASDSDSMRWIFSGFSRQSAKRELKGFYQSIEEAAKVQGCGSESLLLRKAIDYIHRYYDKELSVSDISEYLGISRSYFSQLFSKSMMIPFSKYLMNLRIKKAKELLLNSTLRVYQISNKVGYGNVKYFLKVFRNATGVSPQVFRDKGDPPQNVK